MADRPIHKIASRIWVSLDEHGIWCPFGKNPEIDKKTRIIGRVGRRGKSGVMAQVKEGSGTEVAEAVKTSEETQTVQTSQEAPDEDEVDATRGIVKGGRIDPALFKEEMSDEFREFLTKMDNGELNMTNDELARTWNRLVTQRLYDKYYNNQ